MSQILQQYDLIVVGSGHAGCEATLIAARMGVNTALVTIDQRAIARMSCNPSVGGIGKSQLIAEIDAIGGEIGVNADYTGIQFRTLNTRKGPAVQSSRVQCDKLAYAMRMQAILVRTRNLTLIEGEVTGIWTENGSLAGVELKNNNRLRGKVIIIAPGTFLNGVIHISDTSHSGGRRGEPAATQLSDSLRLHGLTLSRFKTGTPPRLDGRTIIYNKMAIQPGIEPPCFFSRVAREDLKLVQLCQREPDRQWLKQMFHVEHYDSTMRPWVPGYNQMPCYVTYTTTQTHEVIRQNLAQSALYGGYITSTGVRYCPSIEDKIVKFPERTQHRVFIEPEGRTSNDTYPNGLSNSFPENVQKEIIRSIPGLEQADIINYGYAIEYDYSDPTQLTPLLESKKIENLFLAGQINGTTGYEEAAAQGIVAGINAAMKVRGEKPVVFSRNESYLGVLIDDLVTKGVDEPYRMFTSRAEHRLILRQDNAAIRMLGIAKRIGVVPSHFISAVESYIDEINNELNRLGEIHFEGCALLQILQRPGMTYKKLPGARLLPDAVIQQVEIAVKYRGYIQRQNEQTLKLNKSEHEPIPEWVDYNAIKSMRTESRQKLNKIRPVSLGQASRIPGVNPVDIAILAIWIKRGRIA